MAISRGARALADRFSGGKGRDGMRIPQLARFFALASVIALAGCPEKSAAPGATGATSEGGGASNVAATYDFSKKEHLFVIYAAHASGDPGLIQKTCEKYGLYDSKGMPIVERYNKYTESLQKFGCEHPEEWTKFLEENNGKWKEYVQKHM
jgi:hypothetical protein